MNIALLGFDLEGRASYEYFTARGDTVTICDQNADLVVPKGSNSKLGETYLDDLHAFDLVVRTPGLHPRLILERNPGIESKITSGTNEFFEVCPTKNIIGVTGTKGKGTTSTLIAKMLEAAGRTVHLGGNIGTPALSFLADVKPDDWVVLELSSFQLIDLHYSPSYAVCLMIVPEHLNWHADMAEYVQAKSNLFAHQSADDITTYFAANDDSVDVSSAGAGQKIPFFTPPGACIADGVIGIGEYDIARTDELKLLGEHNWQNVCAAITIVWEAIRQEADPTQLVEPMHSVLTTFSGLPHRIELIREIEGVRYFNDSFSTGLHSTEAAVLAIKGPKVLILGGFDRMLPLEHFTTFAVENTKNFRKILIIGASAKRMAAALQHAGFKNYTVDETAKTMTDIVNKARSFAQDGDVIVLSPGFASFDMFKNFEERGNQYRKIVQDL